MDETAPGLDSPGTPAFRHTFPPKAEGEAPKVSNVRANFNVKDDSPETAVGESAIKGSLVDHAARIADEAEKVTPEAPSAIDKYGIVGMTLVRRDTGTTFTVTGISVPEHGTDRSPKYTLVSYRADGSVEARATLSMEDLKEKLETEGSPWRKA